jgi:hypothetical protein
MIINNMFENLKDIIVKMRYDKLQHNDKLWKPKIMIIYDDINKEEQIVKKMSDYFGKFNNFKGNYYHINNEYYFDLCCINYDRPSFLVAGHCDILIYIYTKFNSHILPEILPMLIRDGKIIIMPKE